MNVHAGWMNEQAGKRLPDGNGKIVLVVSFKELSITGHNSKYILQPRMLHTSQPLHVGITWTAPEGDKDLLLFRTL